MSTLVPRPATESLRAPGMTDDAPARPEMSPQERLIFAAYVVMGATILAFLAATSAFWLLGG